MAWHWITVTARSGDAIASSMLGHANNPDTWSLDNFGGIVFRQRREDADSFFFCPKASAVFQPLIAAHDGKPCPSPLMAHLRRPRSSRLVLGFKTDWQPFKTADRRRRARRVPR